MKGMLHLKIGLAYLENNSLLVAGEFNTAPELKKCNKIEITSEKTYGAICILITGDLIVPQGYSKVSKKIRASGYQRLVVNTSEYCEIDGG